MFNAITRERLSLVLAGLSIFLLPWQTHLVLGEATILGAESPFGHQWLYVFDVVILLYVLSRVLPIWQSRFQLFRRVVSVRGVTIGLGVLTLSALASILVAPEPMVAFFGATHLLLAALFLVAILEDQHVSVSALLILLMGSMITPALLGWIQAATQTVLSSTIFGIASQDPATLGTAVIEHAGGRWLRAYGSFSHPNMFGGFLSMALVATWGWLSSRPNMRGDAFGWLAVALFSGALVLSASRGAWLAAFLGSGLWFVGLLIVHDRIRLKRLYFPMLVCVVVVTIVGLSLQSILRTRFDTENRLETQSLEERGTQWDEARTLLAFPRTWFFGVGMHNEPFAVARIKPLRDVFSYQPLHNVPVLVFVELGMIGFSAFLLLVVSSDWLVHRFWNTPSSLLAMSLGLTILALALFDHYLWTQPSGLYLLALFFALNTKAGLLSVPKNKP